MSTRDPELTKLLVQELARHLAMLEAQTGSETRAEVFRRSIHALKGSAGLAGEPELAAVMLRIERRLKDDDESAFAEALEVIRQARTRLSEGKSALLAQWPEPPPDLAPRPIDPIVRAQYVAEVTDRLAQIDEALGSEGAPAEACADVFRHVHTIKGAASAAGDEPMAWFCHGLEERLRSGGASSDAAKVALQEVTKYRGVIGGLMDDSEATLAVLRGTPLKPRPHRPTQRPSTYPDEVTDDAATIRVSAQAVDRLLDHVGGIAVARERVASRVHRASVQAHALRKLRTDLTDALRLIGPPRPWGAPAAALRRIERAAASLSQLGDELDHASMMLDETNQALRDNTGSARKLLSAMRQTPIRGLFGRLSSAALAEARRTGRSVAIRALGAEEAIDRRLVEQITESCLQLTRNAIAHGIETPDEREALGKPREATLTLAARKETNRLIVTISDDGAGVDVSAVRARAVESGLVTETLAEAADDQTLLELLFTPGFSTRSNSPDLLAGRGIGLDITLAAIEKLGGTIRLSSRHGHGFEARVDVPIETGLATVLWVSAGGTEHALPAIHAKSVRLNEGPDADRVPHLAACLEPTSSARAPFVVDLEAFGDAEALAIGVDKVGATEEVLVRELSPLIRGVGPFAGAIVRGDGSLGLALDVHALAPRARARSCPRRSHLGGSVAPTTAVATMIVETMKPEDLEAVLAIDLASFEGHELGVRDGEDLRARREGQLREELARTWSSLRVAREDGVIVGYLLAWKVVDEFHLLNVAVLPERRRAGVGRRLVEDLLARAPAEGVSRVLLEVRASNVAALTLYERLGFVRFNLRAGYYADGEDAIEMERGTRRGG